MSFFSRPKTFQVTLFAQCEVKVPIRHRWTPWFAFRFVQDVQLFAFYDMRAEMTFTAEKDDDETLRTLAEKFAEALREERPQAVNILIINSEGRIILSEKSK